jgi:hypothetical protein
MTAHKPDWSADNDPSRRADLGPRAIEVMDTPEKHTYSSLIESHYEDDHDSLV